MSAHLVIVLFSLLVFACLFLFLLLLFKPQPSSATHDTEFRDSIAGLSAANVQHLEMFFGDGDYRLLGARPELKAVSAKFRRDRRRIALLWLGELERDVHLVWEFRRFLVRNGLQVTFREEVAIASGACFALMYLKAVWLTVFLWGPFALSGALRGAKAPVRQLSTRGAGLLAHAPAPMRAQLQQRWARHLAA